MLIGHGLQKAFGLWGGPGFDGFETSLTDMGFQHADILTYVATGGQIAAGVLLVLGLFTPRGGRRCAGVPGDRHPGGGDGRPRRGQAGVVPHRRPRVQSDLPAAPSRRSSSSAPAVTGWTPVAAGRGGHSSARSPRWCWASAAASRFGCCSTAATRWPNRLAVRVGHPAPAGLRQQRQRRERHRGQPQFAAVLELRVRPRPLAEPQPVDVVPATTVWLPSSVRAVTVSRSATVRYRMIIADRMIGMTSSSATHAGPASTSASRPSAQEADGEMRHRRDPDDDRGGRRRELTPPSSHRRRAIRPAHREEFDL